MRKIIFLAVAAFMLNTSEAQQLTTPQPSPTQTITQNFGLSTIELSYSRPGVKGRKIFGDLVPYGKVWRTGANGATTLTFGDDVIIGGKTIAKGKYGLLTIPDANEWTIIITKQTNVTSPAAYKEAEDVVRVKAKPIPMPMSIETFTISFDDVKSNSCSVGILWDNLYVPLTVETDVDGKVMKQIDGAMNGDNRPYFASAMYYLENGKDLNKALGWFDKAAEQTPDAFWIHYQRANCLAKLGKKKEAKDASMKSMELAKKAENADYVALNEKLQKTL